MTKMNWNVTKQRATNSRTLDAFGCVQQGSEFLKKHPKPAAPTKPKRKRLERWQVTKHRDRQERKELAAPLLKGVSDAPASRLISKT
jgi:hypothetical protein